MDIISVDTSKMQQMSQLSLHAMALIEDGLKAAEAVTIHDDWNCAERDYLCEQILAIQKSNRIISENAESFSRTLNTIAESFLEFETQIKMKYAGFDASIGNMYRINDSSTIVPSNERIDIMPDTYWNQYHTCNLFKQNQIVSFSDANAILQGETTEELSMDDLAKEIATQMGIDHEGGDSYGVHN